MVERGLWSSIGLHPIDVGPLTATVPQNGALKLALTVPADRTGTLYLLRPDGFVDRRALPADVARTVVTVPSTAGEGRYVAELIVDRAVGPSDPEVALLWPYTVGAARAEGATVAFTWSCSALIISTVSCTFSA